MSADATPATAWGLIRRTLLRQRCALAGSIALVSLWQACEAAVPLLIGVVIERAVTSGDPVQLLLWSAVLCVHFGVLSLSYRFGSRVGFRAVQVEGHLLRTEVSSRVLAPRGARTDRLPGEVLSIATADADAVSVVVRQVALTTAALVGLTISGVALASIDLLLAAVVLGGVPVVLVATRLIVPGLARRSAERQQSLGLATGRATDLVRGLRPLKGIGAEAPALARYRVQSRQAASDSVSAARWEGGLFGVTDGISLAFLALVALLAGLGALRGDLGIGELIAVVGLAQFVAEPMGMVAFLMSRLVQSRASAQRIVELLAAPPLVEAGDRGLGGEPSLELRGVDHASLRGVNLSVRPGELVAVLVEQQADAVALMSLLRGEAVPDRGAVLLAGVPLTEASVDLARSRLLVTDHHVDLFAGVIRTNLDPSLALGDDWLERAMDASAAGDLVAAGELGLDEPVATRGSSLSGGQRQRLGLARALAADPPVLVLHDPTTAVDAMTELRIAEGLRALRHEPDLTAGDAPPRTTLVLTSSPALLDAADVVVHLREGRVVAVGRHGEQMARAHYRNAVLR